MGINVMSTVQMCQVVRCTTAWRKFKRQIVAFIFFFKITFCFIPSLFLWQRGKNKNKVYCLKKKIFFSPPYWRETFHSPLLGFVLLDRALHFQRYIQKDAVNSLDQTISNGKWQWLIPGTICWRLSVCLSVWTWSPLSTSRWHYTSTDVLPRWRRGAERLVWSQLQQSVQEPWPQRVFSLCDGGSANMLSTYPSLPPPVSFAFCLWHLTITL